MAFYDDWNWLGTVEKGIDSVGKWFDVEDAADLADNSAYWSSDTGFDGINNFDLGGLFTPSNIGSAAKGLYGAYRGGQRAEDQLALQQPLQDYYASVLPQLQSYYDPANSRKGITSEFERRQGLLTPYWD
jgi:hypothetical protein